MTYWIFIISNTDEEFKKRVNEKKWPIFNLTSNRIYLMKDDLVLFYKAGYQGQKFIGKAELDSKAEKVDDINYTVNLKNIEVWKNGVDIKNILHELAFIGNTSWWGIYLQGGVRRITGSDYDTIVSKF